MTSPMQPNSTATAPQLATEDRWELFRIAGASSVSIEQEMASLAEQLQTGSWERGRVRGEGEMRLAFVANSREDAIGTLCQTAIETTINGAAPPKIAFLFPGMGGESLRGVAELFALSPRFREIVGRANLVTSQRLGISISDIIEREALTGGAPGRSRLFRATPSSTPPTPVAHALLFTLECALAQTWIEWGVKPAFVAGYSLGEYSAAYVAGVFSFEEGLSLIISRATLLDALPKTGMIVVAGEANEVAEHVVGEVYLVAANSTEQTVLGGRAPDLHETHEALRAKGYIVQTLPIQHAVHTPLMSEASRELEDVVRTVRLQTPQIQFVSTLTGTLYSAEDMRHGTHWTRHLREPVQFLRALDSLHDLGAHIFLEVGPGQALSPLVEAHLSSRYSILVAASMPSEYDSRPNAQHVLRTAGRLWAAGVPVVGVVPTMSAKLPQASPAPPVMSKAASIVADTVGEMQQVWSEILGHPRVSADDNFFDLGGNSLKFAKLAMRVKRSLNITLNLREIFSAPTPRLLSEIISEGRRLQIANSDVIVLPNGLSLRCQSRSEALYFYRSIFDERSYLRHGITIGSGMTVFDVGANIGLFSIFAALEAPAVKLYSFEPVPPVFEMLKYNVGDFCEDAEFFDIGVADSEGSSTITYYPNSPGMSSFEANRIEEQAVLEGILRNSYADGNQVAGEVLQDQDEFMEYRFQTQDFPCRLRPLTAIFKEFHVEAVDLLKIDVQKFEMQVLRGIADNYWPAIKQVVLEVHNHHNRVQDVSTFLSDREFKVTVEQDRLYKDTDIYMLYGSR